MVPGTFGGEIIDVGKGCEAAMWAHIFRDEFAGAKALATATVVGDLSKFYENISHSHLRREARQCG